MDIKEKIKTLPNCPGVYLMQDKNGKVIYVGKAADLRKRVSSYFIKPQSEYKTAVLIKQVSDIDIITTLSEHEAFLLESRLIKQFKPRYNISLKDDKSFPFIKITKDDYPRVFIGRKKPNEKVEYIGPYTNAKLLRLALRSLRKVFPFCNCRNFPPTPRRLRRGSEFSDGVRHYVSSSSESSDRSSETSVGIKKECLNFHLGLCLAPCTGKISKKDYRKIIQDLRHFVKKGSKSLIAEFEKRMQKSAEEDNFEEAIKLREKIKALSLLSEQSKVSHWGILGLNKPPHRIEAFDISNLFGDEAVGSMVTFIGNQHYKNDYRRFKIRIVEGIDDYKMIREILNRRYSRVIKENLDKPDLIVIDGGRGHLSVALQQLRDLGLSIPIIAIAKAQELIYTVGNNEPIRLDKKNPVLQLIQRVRDEAHRFAIKYHKLLRKKKMIRDT